ncbi:MAG: SBBP repeat-containing protein, partial [Candidatus Acidiferrum sp.]
LATFLALNHDLPAKQAQRMVARNQVSRALRTSSAPILKAASSAKVNVVKQYGQLPLAFEPTESAPGAQAKFLARGEGYALFLANREAVLELRGPSKPPAVLRMELAGANTAAGFAALEQLPGKSNYFIGNDPKKWRTNVPQYRRVLERDVYRGVNLVYYGAQGQLEYDFDVAPGTDPSVIQIAFQGAEGVKINPQGELVVNTTAGEVRLRNPVAYQEVAGSKQPVAVGYRVKDKSSVSFQVAEYDSSRPLVIDPILAYSTYLGGSSIDTSNAIAVAPDNTAFIAGGTFSSDFPTIHALQPNEGGGPDFPQDAFVSKISADGSTLLYSTYLGGESADTANGIAVDTFGNAYVTGTTSSPHFPHTPNVFGENCGFDAQCGATYNSGGLIITNAFVAKLNIAGSALVYSGFLGYYEYVQGNAIAVDANGNAYVTGRVGPNIPPTVTINPPNVPPPPFPNGNAIKAPTVVSGFDFGIPGVSNAYVTEISSTGASILYSSYVGGGDEDAGAGIAVDATGNAYIT